MISRAAVAASLAAAALAFLPASTRADDWPALGGSPSRNPVAGSAAKAPLDWDPETGRGVLWRAALGTLTYGSPVVAGGRVFIGTNNDQPRVPSVEGDHGVLMAFDAEDGTLLWQAESAKLPSGSVNDWPGAGVCSTPHVTDERLYYVTNRGEVVALDPAGFTDGENDGPLTDEARIGESAADVLWRTDLVAELGVFPRNMSASSPIADGALVFVGTGNGTADDGSVPAPAAPGLVALDAATGRVVWSAAATGARLLDGQWSSPALGSAGGVRQVIFGGADGILYGFAAASGEELWRLDGNRPYDSERDAGEAERALFVATPVFAGGRVYAALGRDPEQGAGDGRVLAVDAGGRGTLTVPKAGWASEKVGLSVSSAAVADGLVFIPDVAGYLHCLDADSGEELWRHDTFAAVWASPLVAAGRVYLADEDGKITVLAAARERRVLAEIELGEAVYGTPALAAGTLYVGARDELWAIDGVASVAPEPPAQGAPPPR